MAQEKPRRGHAAGRGSLNRKTTSSQHKLVDTTRSLAHKQPRPAPAPDLIGLRERLVAARLRLVDRLAEDWSDDRRFPDSGWTKILADVEIAIMAVDAVMNEGGP